jgi:hypothetical protein
MPILEYELESKENQNALIKHFVVVFQRIGLEMPVLSCSFSMTEALPSLAGGGLSILRLKAVARYEAFVHVSVRTN